MSLEGVNGVGKTHLARRVARALGRRCHSLVELPDSEAPQLPGQVIAALHAEGDIFLRTGHPRTEMLLLLALQVHRHEAVELDDVTDVVLEDRGPHTVAAYQAAILARVGDDGAALALAQAILETTGAWRPLPHRTILLRDDPGACLRRFQARIHRRATTSERVLMDRARRVYDALAADRPDQFLVIDRARVDEQTAIDMIIATCRSTVLVVRGIQPCDHDR